jgi:hypothetical protein
MDTYFELRLTLSKHIDIDRSLWFASNCLLNTVDLCHWICLTAPTGLSLILTDPDSIVVCVWCQSFIFAVGINNKAYTRRSDREKYHILSTETE